MRSVGKHGVACAKCGAKTYRISQVCRRCDPSVVGTARHGRPRTLPDPMVWPEDYLMRCAEELLRRHNDRHEILVKLGVKAVAA